MKEHIQDILVGGRPMTKLELANKEIQELKAQLEMYENGVYFSSENDKLQQRIDKAIEYVNTHKPSDTITFPLMKKDEENQVKSCFDYEFEKIYKKELLDILQGVDKE